MSRRLAATAVATLALLVVTACSGGGHSATTTTADGGATTGSSAPVTTAGGPKITGEIKVAAASVFKDVFTRLATTFEEEHVGAKVVFDFGPSDTLASTLADGARVDVFASADARSMDAVVKARRAAKPAVHVFATDRLELAIPPTNPNMAGALSDLANPRLKVGLCVETAACGKVQRAALARAKVKPSVDETAPDAKSLIAKVASGELDVTIVHHSDVVAANGKVIGVYIPDPQNVILSYSIVPLADARNAAGSLVFAAFINSDSARQVLLERGYQVP